MICVNTGPVNEETGKPDSGCGKYFNSSHKSDCKIHAGVIKQGKWTCCGIDGKKIDGCVVGAHKSAEWPNELAKLNFYPKALTNPGEKDKNRVLDRGTLIAHCDFFKKTKFYEKPKEKLKRLKEEKEKENKIIGEPR